MVGQDGHKARKAKKAKKRMRRQTIDDPVQRELDAIKRLLVVILLKAGTPQGEIALALDIDQGDLSRILPARKFPPFPGMAKE